MQRLRDANGNLQVDTARFPHGMKWLGDYIHSKGLKFGIYESAGYKTCLGAAGSYGPASRTMQIEQELAALIRSGVTRRR